TDRSSDRLPTPNDHVVNTDAASVEQAAGLSSLSATQHPRRKHQPYEPMTILPRSCRPWRESADRGRGGTTFQRFAAIGSGRDVVALSASDWTQLDVP